MKPRQRSIEKTQWLFWIIFIVALWLVTFSTFAVVDANSQANTNAPTDGAPWDHLGQVNGSGGSYLGGGWVLTAGHVGPGNVVFDGTTFIWDGALRWLTNSDGSFTDSIMLHLKTSPSLPRLALSSKTPGPFSVVDLIGYGYRSGSAETSFGVGIVGYYWSANPGKSWGNNKINLGGVSTVYDGFTNVSAFAMDFTFPQELGPASQASDEAQAAPWDSGGGVFYKNGSQWELAGMIVAIDEPLTNRPSNTAVYEDLTYAMDIATYRDQIVAWMASSPVTLTIVPAGTNLQVCWLDNGVSYNLEATASLSQPNWATLTPTLSSTNGQICAVIPETANDRFFRLHKP